VTLSTVRCFRTTRDSASRELAASYDSVELTANSEATGWQRNTIQVGMKKSIYLLAMLGLFAACEQKTTTVNPPAEKKESNTTIVNPPSEKKETNTTVVNPLEGSSTTKKEQKTDININTSPNP